MGGAAEHGGGRAGAETAQTLERPTRWGGPSVYPDETAELNRFKPEFANRKYRVYRLQGSGSGRFLAAQRAKLATEALGSGKPQCAEAYATAALRADPDNESAQGLLQLLNDDAFALYEHDPVAPPSSW